MSNLPVLNHPLALTSLLALAAVASCTDDPAPVGVDPDTAPKVAIDRFAAGATLMVRTAGNGLPAADAPIDFDRAPFITHGFRPDGSAAQYYNFDVRSTTPAPIYVLFKPGAETPVPGQLNIIDTIPGATDYNDFWVVTKVQVPADYVANTATSLADLDAMSLTKTATTTIVNCPVVPAGSTATQRVGGGSSALMRGWYQGKVVNYFAFGEAPLTVGASGVPLSPIFVTFNVNPGQPGGGPASGFRTEPGTAQTHNVIGTGPGDAAYSPLWSVSVYDNADFASVMNLATAHGAHQLAAGVATVNCPLAR